MPARTKLVRKVSSPGLRAVFALTLCVSGCYRAYTGIYFVTRPADVPVTTLDDLSREIEEAVKPFGLHKDGLGVFYGLGRANVAPECKKLAGAGANISVAVSLESWIDRFKPFYITIRDYDSLHETEFMRALKNAIEQRLAEHLNITGLRFERQRDMFL